MSVQNGPKEAATEEEDYLTMTLPTEPAPSKHESSAAKKMRQKREAEARAHPKSKVELAEEAETARQKALATSLLPNDSTGEGGGKGAKMMARLGYTPGSTLGKPGNVNAVTEPIAVEVREGRGGIGELSDKKRKFREEVERGERVEKKLKEDEGDYRERVAREREEKRREGQWWGACKVLEGLCEEERVGREKVVPLLYRPLVLDRRAKERDAKRRHDMLQSLSRNPTYDDPEEDEHDRMALGKEVEDLEEEDEEDQEVLEYMALSGAERLEKVVRELRDKWCYCFWCKFRYGSVEEMEGECPGVTEDEHG